MAKKLERGKPHTATARRDVIDIVKTCEAIEDRKFNPFLLDVKYALNTLRKYFPHWRELEDHCLDALALNRLSRVLRLQGSQLRFQSSSLYADPAFLEEKLKALSVKRLAEILVESWHPIAELEQITEPSVREAIAYWNVLAPIEERWRRFEVGASAPPRFLESEDLDKIGVQAIETFEETLSKLLTQLKEKSSVGAVDYQDFICGEDFLQTVERAVQVSFLVTYGYARIVRSDGSMQLLPNEERKLERHPVSFPVSITREVWSKWREKRKLNASSETK